MAGNERKLKNATQNNCTWSPLEDAFEDAFARGLGAGLGLGNFKFLAITLPCMYPHVKYNFPSKTWAIPHSPQPKQLCVPGMGEGDQIKISILLKGGTGVCDHLPAFMYSNTTNNYPFSNAPFIVVSTRKPVERVKITGHQGSKREDCMVRWCKKREHSAQMSSEPPACIRYGFVQAASARTVLIWDGPY